MHELSLGEMPSHTHNIKDPGHSHSTGLRKKQYFISFTGVGSGYEIFGPEGEWFNSLGSSISGTGISIQSSGSSLPHNNMQPTAFISNLFIWVGTADLGAFPILRLAGGPAPNATTGQVMGRLEVYYNETWGTVCADGWSRLNTAIACRSVNVGAWIASIVCQ